MIDTEGKNGKHSYDRLSPDSPVDLIDLGLLNNMRKEPYAKDDGDTYSALCSCPVRVPMSQILRL